MHALDTLGLAGDWYHENRYLEPMSRANRGKAVHVSRSLMISPNVPFEIFHASLAEYVITHTKVGSGEPLIIRVGPSHHHLRSQNRVVPPVETILDLHLRSWLRDCGELSMKHQHDQSNAIQLPR